MTAYTTDGVLIIAKDGRIGDRRDDYTRLTLSPAASALVMAWVPLTTSAQVPALIRKAHKGRLAAVPANPGRMDAGIIERQKIAIENHRGRGWGF